MRVPLPKFAMLLLDHCQRFGVEATWQSLSDGSLPASKLNLANGEPQGIDPSVWMKSMRVHEADGRVVERHPIELLERGDLSWLSRDNSPIVVPDFAALEADMAVPPAPDPVKPEDVYLSPFLEMMLAAVKQFGIAADRYGHVKKETLVEHFQTQRLPDGTAISSNMASMMATFIRPPEATRGGQKRLG